MLQILLAALFFVGIHLFVSGTGLRDRIVGVIGELGFQGVFSVASLAGIVWLSMSWSGADAAAPLWNGAALRPVVIALTFVAFLFAAIGLTTPSPTATGGEGQLDSDEPARGILRVTRHPFLWGVALWGLCHVLVNPDPPSLVFFAAFLVLALTGPASIDRKRARKHGERWEKFAAVTSNVPFAAIAAGRNRLALGELGLWRIALAVVLYGLFLTFHPLLFGAAAL
jgi:uncharacterized membrane protein